jgi:CheY-like chemotaxis protein
MSTETALSPELTGKTNHILVVEDNVALRFALASWLRLLDYVVYEAANGEEATKILRSPIPVDLVVTDLQMPGEMDGLELIEYIRQTNLDLPVILVSANELRRELREKKIIFFRKPYDFDTVSAQIASMLIAAAVKPVT